MVRAPASEEGPLDEEMTAITREPAPPLSKRERISSTMPGLRMNPTPAPAAPAQRDSSERALAATAAPETGTAPLGTDPYLDTTIADRYRVIRKLGEGGMGVVYLAEHVFIEKKVALKILSEEFARKQDLVQRFMQEAKAASRIGHENIVDITDFGETKSGSVFFAMEFLDGHDLAHHVRATGPMPFERVRYVVTQICRALGAAHAKGIIHRDMKPENVFLIEREGRADFVKILDFGIAKMNAMEEGGARLTRTGMIFGTPEYMSPEQAKGDKPDHRVDIYAVGCILYEMLTGDVPFHAETFMGVLTKHMFEAPTPVSQRVAGVPPDVEAAVMKALAKDRDQRFQTMKEMSVALAACGGGNAAEGWGSEPSQVLGPREASGLLNLGTRQPSTAMPVAAGGSAAESDGAIPRSNRGRIIAVAAGAALVLGGVAMVVALQQPPATPAKLQADPPAVVKPEAKTPAPTVQPPPPRPAPKLAHISFRSKPAGAEIVRGEAVLGVTPTTVDFPADSKMVDLVVRKKGFKDYLISVAPEGDKDWSMIELSPLHHSSSSASSSHAEKQHVEEQAQPEKPGAPPPARNSGKLRDLKDPFSSGP